MADYGNNFTSNSNDYYYKTNGHTYDDSDWVIVDEPYETYLSYYIWPNGAEFVGNNTNTYFYTNAHLNYPPREVKTGTYYVSYYQWFDNRNVQGSISGDFSLYPFNDKNSSKLLEPTGLDDTSHGVTPYSSSNNNALTRVSLNVKGTTYTAGYRRHLIKYGPRLKANAQSYNDGTVINSNSHSQVSDVFNTQMSVVSRYDALQTFYNEVDPYGNLSISISNHDDAKSSSPTFCTLTNNKSEYRINHSYAYNPYVNSATWNNTNYLSFTYNTLPTYPKNLVFTYDSNWNDVSYDGGNVYIEAKALYNRSYDRFTTSTANDDGFSSYKRYVDVTYSMTVSHSSTAPSGMSSYTFRIWQPGSTLGISYKWSIDNSPSWAHLSTTSGNTTTVSFDDQGDYKGTISGKLSINPSATTGGSQQTYNGDITGVTFTAQDNKSRRTCTVRQNMTVTNCIAQNITPKDNNNQPYQVLTLAQNAAVWEDPAFNLTVRVTQDGKTNSPTSDDLNYEWPTFKFAEKTFTPTKSDPISVSDGGWPWKIGTSSKAFSITYPKINDLYTRSNCSGSASCSIESGNISYSGGSKTITVKPNVTFKKKRYEGYSSRKWTLKCVSVDPDVALDNQLSGFDDIQFTMTGIAKHDYGTGVVTFSLSGVTTTSSPFSSDVTTRTMSASDSHDDETLNANTNSVYDKKFTITAANNSVDIGSWSSSTSGSTIKFSSTTKNKNSRYIDWSISSSTSEDGTVTMSGNSGRLTQDSNIVSGTITVSSLGSCSISGTSYAYPVNTSGNATTTGPTYSVDSPSQRYVTGASNLTVSVTSPSGNTSVNGGTIYVTDGGYIDIDSIESKTKTWSISATSNIVSTNPSNGNPILSGSITPYSPDYHFEYKLNSGSWTKDTSFSIGSNTGSLSNNYGASLSVASSWTDCSSGIYNYTRGRYTTDSTSSRTDTIYISVVDDNSGSRYEGGSTSKTQDGDSGTDYYTNGSWTITPSSDYNCSVSTTSISFTGGTDKDESGIGSFTVTPSWSGSTPTSNTGSSGSGSYVFNFSGSTSTTDNDDALSSTLYGDNKTFEANETISQNYGVTTSSPDTTSRRTRYSATTWNYEYKYSVKASNESSGHSTTKTGSGSVTPSTETTTLYRYVNGGSGWERLTSPSKDFTATTTGTFTVEICWAATVSNCSGSNRYGYNSKTITIGQKVNHYDYRVIVTISISSGSKVEHDAWSTDDFSSSVTASAVGQRRLLDADNNVLEDWTDVENVSVSVSYSGAVSGSGTTATGSYDCISMGSNGSDGNDTIVTFTATSSSWNGKTNTSNVDATWCRYGKTYYNA